MREWIVIFEPKEWPDGIALMGGPSAGYLRVQADNASDAVGAALRQRSAWEEGTLWAAPFSEFTNVAVTKRYEFREHGPGWPGQSPREDV